MNRQWLRNVNTLLSFALVYWLADVGLNQFAFSDGWTIVWPLNGVTIALMLKRPRAAWCVMLLGIELGTGIGECMDSNPVGLEIGERICSAVEVLVCASLLPRYTDLQDWLRTPHIHARFIAALAFGPGLSGLMSAILFHAARKQDLLWAFNNWATADALGIAAILPLALSFTSPQMRDAFTGRGIWKTSGLLLFAFAGAALIFSVSQYPLLFLLYPLLLLVESVLAFVGSAIAAAGVCLIAIYFTTKGWGPFGTWPPSLILPRDLALQIFFGFHLITLFPMSVMLLERRRLGEERERLAEDLLRSNQQLTSLVSLDGLTGIANRRAFDEHFGEQWDRAVRFKSPLALVILDLDHFKQFNDLYGHAKGDACLKSVAQVLGGTASHPNEVAARFGGEEFAILLPDATAERARELGERVRVMVLDLGIAHLGNSSNRVSVSVGYASVTPCADDKKVGLIQLADAALYSAKRKGRNCVETITSMESFESANGHSGDTTKIRLRGLLTRADRR